ncbi:hypothetical protein N0B44_18250 [Roseibacterium beibuensis]|uniref:hypothetical protein n=1 Tax=[Roseibacterium] beibuensis TaxID=1193142 RepID=UPI00217DD222|nr:hypothetical protein [Roseibacterium beibuensis]MCS6624861.1 hypothetical protein [Roseibacterium beibuensis]
MFDTLYSQIGAAVGVIVVAFAFLKGDEPERVGAGAYALGSLAALLLQNDSQLYGPQWGLMSVEAIMLAAYAALAWKSRRPWPIWAAALQAVVVMSHVLTTADVRPPIAAFYAVVNLASYGILLAILIGVLQAWRDRRALGLG